MHITDIESGNMLVCSTISIRTNSATTPKAARIVCLATIVPASLDTAAQMCGDSGATDDKTGYKNGTTSSF